MGTKNRDVINLQVKYCENCGVLWIRKQGDVFVYCPTCREMIEAQGGALKNTSLAPATYAY
jgi:uncharacterized Zn finger protein (UPF0148 family)